jgi:hypothetical protein
MRHLWVVLIIGLYGALAVEGRPHPVGPARTQSAYVGKATTAAKSALAEVQTARLVARGAGDGREFGPHASVALSDAEDALSGISDAFASIQQPKGADTLRADLDNLLSDALSHTGDVRVAVRRGDTHGIGDVARPLDDDARALQDFLRQNGAE